MGNEGYIDEIVCLSTMTEPFKYFYKYSEYVVIRLDAMAFSLSTRNKAICEMRINAPSEII